MELLKECVNSVLAQSYSHWECIIVNDGSTDGTQKWIESLTDERIQFVLLQHGERSNARNKGLEKCTGSFVHFIDDDDIVTTNYLADFVNYRENHNDTTSVIRCGMEMFWADGQCRKTANYDGNKYKHPIQFLIKEMCGTGCLSIPTQSLVSNKFDVRWPHWQDTHLFLRILHNHILVQLPGYNYLYRQHDAMGTRMIFSDASNREKRLKLTLSAMRDIRDHHPDVNRYIAKREWSRIFANKYMNYALETANQGKMVAWRYLLKSWSYGIYLDQMSYYMRIPFFQFRSLF